MPLKICAVTSSRADWGLLAPVLIALRADASFDLKVVVTGQHLVVASGRTANDILSDGFAIDDTVAMDLRGDTPEDIASALATVVDGCGKTFARLRPDLLLVLGDRYEILGVVTAATLGRIPVAHIAGGDVTEGAMDDAFRHAITKMAHLHFVTTEVAGRRVRQLGEDPARVHVTGSPGLDRIKSTPVMERVALFSSLGLEPRQKTLLVTFHPETLTADSETYCNEMLAALDRLGPDAALLFSGTNADVQGLAIGRLISDFVARHDNAVLHQSLGSARYFSALKYADVIVGNSSSGLYEAPSFGIPTVNIGDRQKGRVRSASVIDVRPDRESIFAGIQRAFALDCTGVANPYGDGNAASRIVAELRAIRDPAGLLKKRFMDLAIT